MQTIDYKKFCGVDTSNEKDLNYRAKAYEVNDRIKKFVFYKWIVPQIEKKYPISEVKKIIVRELKLCIERCQQSKDKIFNEYLKMTDEGKDFDEKKEWLKSKNGRLIIIEKYQANLIETLGYDENGFDLIVLPYKDWLEPGHEDLIEEKGFEEFIKFNGFILKNAYVKKRAKKIKSYCFE